MENGHVVFMDIAFEIIRHATDVEERWTVQLHIDDGQHEVVARSPIYPPLANLNYCHRLLPPGSISLQSTTV